MNARDYAIWRHGYDEATAGAGLSDDPYGGRDGFIWRRGVQARLDEEYNQEPGHSEKVGKYDEHSPGAACAISR